MYLDHFGLKQPPFKITPNTEFFYSGGNRGAILDALLYAVVNGEGIIKVTGDIGSGKTMLCRMLEDKLPENIEAIYLANPSLNRDEVFHAIASELGIETEGKRGGEIMRLLQNNLIEKHAASKQVVLLVEEAQAMPLETLEEIRLLSNLETAHHKLLQIVLFGQPELDDHLNLPQMRQLKERITHGFIVPPLDQNNIPEYLICRLRAAGYHGPNIFKPNAIKPITASSQGITRRVNILADKAMLAAFSDNTHDILPKHVQAAIEDSEFAPPSRMKRWKPAILAAVLLGTGMSLGLGWKYATSPSAKISTPTTEVAQILPAPVPAPALTPNESAVLPPTPAAQPVEQTIKPTETSPPVAVVTPAVTAPAITPAAVAAATKNELQQRLDATQVWLAKEDESHYTVQLMLMTDSGAKSQLESTLINMSKEIDLAQIYIYPTRITADHQFGITFGNYTSREQALAAQAKLPASYQKDRPLLRTVKGIRNEIAKQQVN